MFRQVGVPVLGIVENMSYFVCGNCGSHAHIFGHGGVEKTAEELHMPLLGKVSARLVVGGQLRQRWGAGKPGNRSRADTLALRARFVYFQP